MHSRTYLKSTALVGTLAAALISACIMASPAQAGYPEGKITMIIPFSPGGDTDIRTRLIQPFLQKALGVGVAVVNRPGAGGIIGYTAIAEAKPDGYTIGAINFPSFASPIVEGKTTYTVGSYEPLVSQSSTSTVFVTQPDSGFKTVAEVVEFAKANPNVLTVGVTGIGHPQHLGILQFQNMVGAKFNFVPFGGGPQSRAALLGGHVKVAVFNNTEVVDFKDTGKMHVLGIMSDERDPALPDVPTFSEQGWDLVSGSVGGFAAPAGTPQEFLEVLEKAFSEAAADPEYLAAAKKQQMPLRFMARTKYKDFIATSFAGLKAAWDKEPWVKK